MSRSSSDPLEVPGQLGPLFAKADPQTSREAAKRVLQHLGKQQEFAFGLIRMYPGFTAKELGQVAYDNSRDYRGFGVEDARQRIGRRLNELEKAGLIRWEGERDGCRVWWPVEESCR